VNPIALTAATVAMLCWGGAAIFDKLGMRGVDNPLLAIIIRMAFATVILFGYALATGALSQVRTVPRGNVLALLASALLAAIIGQFAYYVAMKHGEASRVVPFSASYPVVAMVLAVLFLREPVTALKIVGTFMVMGGLMLVSGVGGK